MFGQERVGDGRPVDRQAVTGLGNLDILRSGYRAGKRAPGRE